MASPPRGARSGGHDSCQAARTTATCHDLEEERAAMGQRCRPQSFGEVQRGNPQLRRWLDYFQLNSSSAAVETKAESEPATSLSRNLYMVRIKYCLLTLGRPSVPCYSTLRAWSPVCGSTLRVSQAARQRWLLAVTGLIFLIFVECCGMNSFFLVTQSFSPHR